MVDTTLASVSQNRSTASYTGAAFRAAQALVTGRQFAHDRQMLVNGPQPDEIERPFAFLTRDMNDPLHCETLISNITRSGVDLPESFRADMSSLPLSAFTEKYADVFRQMEIRVGTRPVRFDGKDFASSISDFRMPDIDVGQQHVNLQFHLGDQVQVVDGYKTSPNGSKNVTTTGTIVAGQGNTERVAIHLNNMPVRGEETITMGFDGRSVSADTVFHGNAVEGLHHYWQALETGTRLNLSDTAYAATSSNGNTGAGLMLNEMGLPVPESIRDGKIIIDGKPRGVPGMSAANIAALEERYRTTPALATSGEPTFMELIDRIGSAHRELRLSQPDALYRANGPRIPATQIPVEPENARLSVPSEAGWSGAGRVSLGLIGIAPVAINLVDAVVKGDPTKTTNVVVGAVGMYGATATATAVAGRFGIAEAIPVAGEALGGVFAAADTYHALKTGHSARAAISGIETTLYGVSAVAGAAAVFDFWNPVGWGAGAVAAVAGTAAVTITAGKAIYDNWGTIKGWFDNHAPDPHGSVTLQSAATRNLVPQQRSGRGMQLRGETTRDDHTDVPTASRAPSSHRQSRLAPGMA